MSTIVRPDLDAIKARLGSLAPGKLALLASDYPAVAQLLIDCKHLVSYVEEVAEPALLPPEPYLDGPEVRQ